MTPAEQDQLADTVGTDVGRATLLREIISKVDGLDVTGSDEELDQWWGLVEVDRLASGLTLATIARLAEPDSSDESAGPWLSTSGVAGHETSHLTPEGREALRHIGSAGDG
jgi:hypothetical protein